MPLHVWSWCRLVFSKETCLKAVALRAVDYSKYTLALEEGNSLAHNCTSLTLRRFCGCHGNYGCLTPRKKESLAFHWLISPNTVDLKGVCWGLVGFSKVICRSHSKVYFWNYLNCNRYPALKALRITCIRVSWIWMHSLKKLWKLSFSKVNWSRWLARQNASPELKKTAWNLSFVFYNRLSWSKKSIALPKKQQ